MASGPSQAGKKNLAFFCDLIRLVTYMNGGDYDGSTVKDGTVDIRGNPANKEKTGRWKACFFIFGNECCETLANYGMSANLVNYFIDELHMGNARAANNVNNWTGTCNVMPLLGAFLADAYWGKYWVIAIFSIIYAIGMGLLTLSASIKGLNSSCTLNNDKCHPTTARLGLTFAALYLIALGTGGITPCVSSFGADQFDENDEKENKQRGSFFTWFYFSINVGALIACSVLVYIQLHVGWGWGFGVPAVAMALSVISFFSGSKFYRLQKPGGSPLTRMAQVLVATVRKFKVQVPEDHMFLYETTDEDFGTQGSRTLEHSDTLRCLDKAAVPIPTDDINGEVNPWRLCTVSQVEELKAVLKLFPIWTTGIVYSAVYSQMTTMFILQGNTMDQHIGPKFKIPSASLSIFDTLSVLFWAPVYDKMIVPLARKYTGHKDGLTILQRMGIGLVISVFSMISAGILEVARLNMVKQNNYYDLKTVPMSIFWQVPQYFLIGCSEVFTYIGQMDFFYDQAPDAMRSFCSAISLMTTALGSYLSSLLVTIVMSVTTRNGNLGWIPDNLNKGHLDYFYWVLAVLSVLNFVAYLLIARKFTYNKKATNRSI